MGLREVASGNVGTLIQVVRYQGAPFGLVVSNASV